MIRIIGPHDQTEPGTINTTSRSSVDKTIRTTNPKSCYPIEIVHRKTFRGRSEYIGRSMPGLSGSHLANQFKVRPHGPFTRQESVNLYRRWLWEQLNIHQSPARLEMIRLTAMSKTQSLILSCWCAPELCHGTVIKNALKYLIETEQLHSKRVSAINSGD